MLVPPPQLLSLLRERGSFLIATHRGPDGDALGASLALAAALRAAGKQVTVAAPTPPGSHYLWMPGVTDLITQPTETAEVAILVDCDLPRIDHLAAVVKAVATVAVIDHHPGSLPGNVSYLDPAASAACCLVWRVLEALGWPVTADIASCLYTGVFTDTGGFRFENTNSEALGIAAQLAESGAEPFLIAEKVSERRPVSRLRLAGRALGSLQTAAAGRIIWGGLTPEDYSLTGTGVADTEGIVDLLKQAEGQEVCVLFKAPGDLDSWQVSLRSRTVDVAEIARRYGGGGHARAAGFDHCGPLAGLRDELLAALVQALPPMPEGA